MSYRDTLLRLAGTTETAVAGMYERLDSGDLGAVQFTELTTVTVARSNRRAVALADVALAATISVQLGRVIPPLGLDPPDDTDRLRKAAAAIAVTGSLGTAARLGRAEPLETAARAYSEGIRRSPHVTGWERQTSGNACPLCEEWATFGVLPDTTEMLTHKGCSCIPVPVTKG